MRDIASIIDEIIKNPDYCPALLLGQYTIEFKKKYKKPIYMASTLESVRAIVDNFSGIPSLQNDFLVLDGIGFLSEAGLSSLLKFIEESSFPIICLSVFDRIIPTIMSRMKFVFKKPLVQMKKLDFTSLERCYETIEKDFTYFDRVRHYIENNPVGYYLEMHGSNRLNNRINRIISKIK